VVATDIPVLREVGIEGVRFCAASNVADWSVAVNQMLASSERVAAAGRDRIVAHYSWMAHAATIAEAYAREPRSGSLG
jgi:glycosyltransferase involved in cell wall biosynthesis